MSTPQHLWVLDVSALAITARKVSSYYGGINIHKSVRFGDVAVYHFVVTFGDFLTWYGTSCNAFVPCGTNFTNVFNWPNNPSQGCSQKLCWTSQNFNHFFSTIVVEGTVHYVREYPLNWLRAEITALGCASGPLFHPSANSSGILYYLNITAMGDGQSPMQIRFAWHMNCTQALTMFGTHTVLIWAVCHTCRAIHWT